MDPFSFFNHWSSPSESKAEDTALHAREERLVGGIRGGREIEASAVAAVIGEKRSRERSGEVFSFFHLVDEGRRQRLLR